MIPNFPPAASNIASQAAPRCAPASPSGGGAWADEKLSNNLRDGILAPRSITPDREGQTVSRRPSTPLSHDAGNQPPSVATSKVEARPLRSCAHGDERYRHAQAQCPNARGIEDQIIPWPLAPSTGLDAGHRSPSARTSDVEAVLAPRSATPDREGQTVPRRPSTPLGHDAGHQPPGAAKSKADARPPRSCARGDDRYRHALASCPDTQDNVGRMAPRPLAPSMGLDAGIRPPGAGENKIEASPLRSQRHGDVDYRSAQAARLATPDAAGFFVPRQSPMGLGDEGRALIADEIGSEGPPLLSREFLEEMDREEERHAARLRELEDLGEEMRAGMESFAALVMSAGRVATRMEEDREVRAVIASFEEEARCDEDRLHAMAHAYEEVLDAQERHIVESIAEFEAEEMAGEMERREQEREIEATIASLVEDARRDKEHACRLHAMALEYEEAIDAQERHIAESIAMFEAEEVAEKLRGQHEVFLWARRYIQGSGGGWMVSAAIDGGEAVVCRLSDFCVYGEDYEGVWRDGPYMFGRVYVDGASNIRLGWIRPVVPPAAQDGSVDDGRTRNAAAGTDVAIEPGADKLWDGPDGQGGDGDVDSVFSPLPVFTSDDLDVTEHATTLCPESTATATPGIGSAAEGETAIQKETAVGLAFHAALHLLQAFFRGVDVRSGNHRRRGAQVAIAAWRRGQVAQRNLRRRRAQVTIAAWRRGQVARRRLQREAAAVTLTAWGRGWATRGHLRRQALERCAATTITAVIAAWMRGRIPRQQLAAAKSISHWVGFRRSYRLFCDRREILRRWYLSECQSLVDAAFSPSPADGAQRKRQRRRRRRRGTRSIAEEIPDVQTSAATLGPRGAGTSYADVARSTVGARDGVCAEWPRGKTHDRPVKRASRRRRSGRPRNSQRRPRHRNSGHGSGNTCFETNRVSDGEAGTATTMDMSDDGAGGLTMPAEDPPGDNAAAISRHKRYLRASADDPRYQRYLARSHPFRNKGSWHPPSRRHRNGRHRKQMADGVYPVSPEVSSGPDGSTDNDENPGYWERLAEAHPFRDRGGGHRPPRTHNKLS